MPAKNASDTITDVKKVLKGYDANDDGVLDDEELATIKRDFEKLSQDKSSDEVDAQKQEALEIVKKRYHTDDSATLSAEELHLLQRDVHLTDFMVRYFAYMGLMARSARYFRVLFKPFGHPWVLKGSFGLSFAFIAGDVAFEGYCAQEKQHPRTDLVMLKRTIFQLTASIWLPVQTMKVTSKLTTRFLQRFIVQRFPAYKDKMLKFIPPSCCIGMIPLLPYMWDKPTMFVVDRSFRLLTGRTDL